jgi:MFS transporter, SP family, arabinose:H+ symporter
MTDETDRGNTRYTVKCAAAAALGGLLFGYDVGVIAGAVPFVTEQFSLNAHQEGFAVSNVLIGCLIGSGLSGILSDRFGRKPVMIATAMLFILSAILSSLATGYVNLIAARILGGVAVGATMVSALYISEISPARIRGILVTFNQFAIVIGILLTYIVNWLIADAGPNNWRWMFASESIPAILFLIALMFVPETPRWLIKQGRIQEARGVLGRLLGSAHAAVELDRITAAIALETGSILDLVRKELRKALFIGVLISIFAQIVGIGTVIYYAPKIFMRAGFHDASSALFATISVGFVNFSFTIVSFFIIDRFGRKPLLYIGIIGMCAAMTATGLVFQSGVTNVYLVVIPVLVFVGSYAMSLGPVAWVIIAEIFPTKIRGAAMSISMMVLWVADFAVSQTFPWLLDTFGGNTFYIYTGINVLAFLFVLFILPETKGKSLEEVEMMWQ